MYAFWRKGNKTECHFSRIRLYLPIQIWASAARSRVLARLVSLAQIGELARRLARRLDLYMCVYSTP